MLRGSPSRRVAAVLMTALVAVLLVPFAGASRAPAQRTSVGSAQVSAVSHAVRAAHATPAAHDVHVWHLDASTPPADAVATPERPTYDVADGAVARSGQDLAAPTGRGPPAL